MLISTVSLQTITLLDIAYCDEACLRFFHEVNQHLKIFIILHGEMVSLFGSFFDTINNFVVMECCEERTVIEIPIVLQVRTFIQGPQSYTMDAAVVVMYHS